MSAIATESLTAEEPRDTASPSGTRPAGAVPASTAELWAAGREVLRASVPAPVWMGCFKHLAALRIDDELALLAAPSNIIRDRIQRRYIPMLHAAFRDLPVQPSVIRIEAHPDTEQLQLPIPDATTDTLDGAEPAGELGVEAELAGSPADGPVDALTDAPAAAHSADPDADRPPTAAKPAATGRAETARPLYTFDGFVTGSGNRFAQAAALAVAETPGVAYNPLFIHGATGLGKTHLLQAIVNYLAQNTPEQRVLYVSTETFLSEFIEAIGTKTTTEFKRRYRELDVLLLDDIQILQQKEALQEELFHTFNSLHVAGRQLVISSDRPPRNIATLSDRLRSRFEWGLITDIQPPDLETRVAILRKKEIRLSARAGCGNVPDDVLEHIAHVITNNIRELEGALLRVCALASLNGTSVDMELVKQSLEGTGQPQERLVTPDLILQKTSEVFGYSVADLTSQNRQQGLVLARQISMYVMREMTDLSYPAIAKVFGGRDHTTAMHAVKKITSLLPKDRKVYDLMDQLTARVRAA